MSPQPTITTIEPVANGEVLYKGDLSQGQPLADLSWAWSSANACFPETQKQKFTGNHVFFSGIIPKYSEMTVTVIPDDANADFSVYAYEIGATRNDLVPNLSSCIRCEADHKWDRPKAGKTQDHTRTVTDLVAINTPYKVIIGVTGANGLASGGFTLKVSMKSR
ncbi:MAG: hypothetical protein E6Q96_01970 [Cyclobacteriaceae bacterium]|nr:MAG: hypothetical protein E6Q96_01970 [Cyclobacteriaceae bacterium]